MHKAQSHRQQGQGRCRIAPAGTGITELRWEHPQQRLRVILEEEARSGLVGESLPDAMATRFFPRLCNDKGKQARSFENSTIIETGGKELFSFGF